MRAAALFAGEAHQTAHCLSDDVVARTLVERTVVAETGDSAVYYTGIDLLEDIVH